MRDYAEAVKNFSAAELERKVLHGSLANGVNACEPCRTFLSSSAAEKFLTASA